MLVLYTTVMLDIVCCLRQDGGFVVYETNLLGGILSY